MTAVDRVLSLLIAYEDRLEAGETVTPEEICADSPGLLDEFRRQLRALEVFQAAHDAPADDGAEAGFVVGEDTRYRPEEFRARGGLGEVHVAADVELGRRVALKRIRPLHSGRSDARRRFLREALITARLEHPGIVPVYGMVRDAGGRPCYAMRLIEGQSLQEAIADLHGREHGGRATPPPPPDLRFLLARFVAVCNAVAYAHSQGIVHRDLKPDNIMLGRFGETLVVDWGLATSFASPAARPGAPAPAASDLDGDGAWMETRGRGGAGTLGYGAPEQLAGRPGAAAPAADVFSLGAILYALLRGVAPPRDGGPLPAERPHRRIPRPLWSICRRAMAAEPAGRYPDAVSLAAEVERWLAGEGVEADPEPWTDRARRWALRHRVGVATATSAVLVAALIGGVFWRIRAAEREQRALDTARFVGEARPAMLRAGELEAVARASLLHADLAASAAAWRKAEDLLDRAGRPAELWPEALGRRARLETVAGLVSGIQDARMAGSAIRDERFDRERRLEGYRQALRRAGIDPLVEPIAPAAERIRELGVAEVVLAAIDEWFAHADPATRSRLIAFAARIDPDAERRRIRSLPDGDMRPALARRADAIDPRTAPRVALQALCTSLVEKGEFEAGCRLLRRALEVYPDDFWFHHDLGITYIRSKPQRLDLAARSLHAAIALNPRSAGAYVDLAYALELAGDHPGSIAAARRAKALAPRLAAAEHHLGLALQNAGDVKGAVAALSSATRLDPGHPGILSDLGSALAQSGQHQRAIEEARRAVELSPDSPGYHLNLGTVFRCANRPDLAVEPYRKALELDPDSALVRFQLGSALSLLSRSEEAAQVFRDLVRLVPGNASARGLLGATLNDLSKPDEAEPELREAVRLDPRHADAHSNLGFVLYLKGELEEALGHLSESARLKEEVVEGRLALIQMLAETGEDEASLSEWSLLDPIIKEQSVALANGSDVLLALGDPIAAANRAREAIRICPRDGYPHLNLGNAMAYSGRLSEALACFTRAIDRFSDLPEAHWARGLALLEKGDFEGALQSLTRAQALGLNPAGGPTTSSEWVRCAERAIQLSGRLAGIVAGTDRPEHGAEALKFAQVCLGTGSLAASLRLYEEGLRAAPALGDDLVTQPRFHAALAALQIARGRATSAPPPDTTECARLRASALTWLRADLDAWRRRARGGRPDDLWAVRTNLRLWKLLPEFAGVRSPALVGLPKGDSDAWRGFWAEVDAEIGRTLAGVKDEAVRSCEEVSTLTRRAP